MAATIGKHHVTSLEVVSRYVDQVDGKVIGIKFATTEYVEERLGEFVTLWVCHDGEIDQKWFFGKKVVMEFARSGNISWKKTV